MDIKIENNYTVNEYISESNAFIDLSGNLWRLDVTDNKIYVFYLGRKKDRVEKFKIISPEGYELVGSHKNIFSMSNSLDNYYIIRHLIKQRETIDIWKAMQRQIIHSQFTI